MKKNALRSFVVMMIAVMVVAMMPVTAHAATKKPAKVKVTSVKVTAVSTSTNNTTMTIKWKKANRATGYIIYAKHGNNPWVKQKKVGRFTRKITLQNTPAGQIYVRVRAVNKKKLGKYSTIKKKYIASPLTLQQYANRIEPSMKYGGSDVDVIYSGNTATYVYDLYNNYGELTSEQLEAVKSQVNTKGATLQSSAKSMISTLKLNAGISGVTVIYKYTYNGETLASFTYR